ncbi:MAG TPA: hypothetical protein VK672_04915 [Solirubrobacteraceae bacterium]|jgi:hypothetical protein|nr:hypothetical protein [Solirubrobacteraceae bacterium]
MAQLSRPYQIALGVVAVLGLVWAMALRGHGSSPSEPAPTTPAKSAPAPTAASEARAAAAPTPIYQGAAPGVEGLTRAIAKAHGAVATSQQNAQQLQNKSAQASGESTPPAGGVAAVKGVSGASATQRSIEAAALARRTAARTHTRTNSPSKSHKGRTVAQIQVEGELARGKTVMLVFWNPKSTVDQEVHSQAGALVGGSKGTVTMHAALAHQVGTFGKITEVVHVYQTPTILIVNRRGVVSTLTGLTDVFALQQAVREARSAGR